MVQSENALDCLRTFTYRERAYARVFRLSRHRAVPTVLVAAHLPLPAGHPSRHGSMETRCIRRGVFHRALALRRGRRALSASPADTSRFRPSVPGHGSELRTAIPFRIRLHHVSVDGIHALRVPCRHDAHRPFSTCVLNAARNLLRTSIDFSSVTTPFSIFVSPWAR